MPYIETGKPATAVLDGKTYTGNVLNRTSDYVAIQDEEGRIFHLAIGLFADQETSVAPPVEPPQLDDPPLTQDGSNGPAVDGLTRTRQIRPKA